MKGAFSTPVCAKKQTNGPPVIDQGFSTGSCNRRHALSGRAAKAFLQAAATATMHCQAERWTHPPLPVPPFLLAQNLSSKGIRFFHSGSCGHVSTYQVLPGMHTALVASSTDPLLYRFGDPPFLNLCEFGDPRIDLGTLLSIDVNGCTMIDPIGLQDLKNIENVKGCRDGMPKSMQTR